MNATAARPLRKILGLGFGLAIVFGGTVGVGILRLPGVIAGALGDPLLVVLFWLIGGLYALLGAVAVAELATMFPQAGGFRVYAQRAFGNGVGFVIGWCDWLCNVAALSYGAMTAATFFTVLVPIAGADSKWIALTIISIFTLLHWVGLRLGSTLTSFISMSVGLMLMVLVVGCFIVPPVAATSAPLDGAAASLPLASMAMLTVVVMALRSVLVAYDGWYSAIYMAEENTDPARTLPRAIIGGTLLVIAVYLLINVAFLRVLPLPVLAAAELPAAEAARALMPQGGPALVTVISLLTVLSLVNATLLMAPRILLAIGRDGYLTAGSAGVSESGTPRVALGASSLASMLMVLTGTFEQIIALAAILFMLLYISAYCAVFVLRRREPTLPRPFRAVGFPVTTAVVLLGSVSFLVAAVIEDQRSALIAIGFIALCSVVYVWRSRQRVG